MKYRVGDTVRLSLWDGVTEHVFIGKVILGWYCEGLNEFLYKIDQKWPTNGNNVGFYESCGYVEHIDLVKKKLKRFEI